MSDLAKYDHLMMKPHRYDVRGNIALVDADLLDGGTRHPNLVIMKLAGYFKERGCTVHLVEKYSELYCDEERSLLNVNADGDIVDKYANATAFDAIYISKVFDFTKIDSGLLELDNVYIGGTGFFFDHSPRLPEEIEHHMPDYHIYDEYIEHDERKNKHIWYKDYLDYSIGFATRGCFRQCDFCVNRNCKKVEFHSHIEEWVDPNRKYIYLWDDNIFGFAHWREVFEELIRINKPFQFRQGLDLRLLTAEKAEVLNRCKYHGDYIFAFDHIEDAPVIENKLKLWRQHCDKPTKLYVLSGFDGIDEKEIVSVFERIRILLKYGCLPYIMRHENYLNSPYKGMFIQLARWCNQPQFLKKLSFRQYCEQCQKYHKSDSLSAPMKAMTEFEDKFPDIASKYFDIEYLKQEYVIEWKRRHPHGLKGKDECAESDGHYSHNGGIIE